MLILVMPTNLIVIPAKAGINPEERTLKLGSFIAPVFEMASRFRGNDKGVLPKSGAFRQDELQKALCKKTFILYNTHMRLVIRLWISAVWLHRPKDRESFLLEDQGVSYQLCRWYDPYPRLAFALKMLHLAPVSVQARVGRELQRFIDENWSTPQKEWAYHDARFAPRGKRWYDEDADTRQAVELIRNSPAPLKSRVADTLLEILIAE